MKKCDEMGGIPYHINVVNYMVRAAPQQRRGVGSGLPWSGMRLTVFYVVFCRMNAQRESA